MKARIALTVWFIAVIFVVVLSGCDTMRFAPTEEQKQTAMLTHNAATEAVYSGLEPKSQEARLLEQGTLATTLYYGAPEKIPAKTDFTTEKVAVAQSDAAKRPSFQQVADTGLSMLEIILGTGVLGIGGTAIGTRILASAKKGRDAAIALEQVVKGNKEYLRDAPPEQADAFRAAQNAKQDDATKVIVATVKATA
jgi:hypothetical protein